MSHRYVLAICRKETATDDARKARKKLKLDKDHTKQMDRSLKFCELPKFSGRTFILGKDLVDTDEICCEGP